jgi:hypothetical protein
MAKDEFKNLGFMEEGGPDRKPKDVVGEGKKGELRW